MASVIISEHINDEIQFRASDNTTGASAAQVAQEVNDALSRVIAGVGEGRIPVVKSGTLAASGMQQDTLGITSDVSLDAPKVAAEELIAGPNSVIIDKVRLENDFRKYLTLGEPDGGYLIKSAVGELINIATVARDEAVVYGHLDTYTILGFDASKPGIIVSPLFKIEDLPISTIDDTPAPVTQVQLNGQTVYQVRYETGSLGFNGNVTKVKWSFKNTNNRFRVIIRELGSGLETYAPTADADFLKGDGFFIAGSGPQTWDSIVPAIWRVGLNYEVIAQSLSPDFNLMGTTKSGEWVPYAMFEAYVADLQSAVSLPQWSPGMWVAGDQIFYIYENSLATGAPRYRGKILTCLVTGEQTGPWVANSSKWDELSGHVTGEEIKDALEALSGNARLDSIAIKNLPPVVTDEHIQDVVGAMIVANAPLHVQYDDQTGRIILSMGPPTGPVISGFTLSIPAVVRTGTDLNAATTVTFNGLNVASITDLKLKLDAAEWSVTIPTADGQATSSVTLSGIDTATAKMLTFKLVANGSVESNSYVVQVRADAVENYIYYGPTTIATLDAVDIVSLAEKIEILPHVDTYSDAHIAAYTGNKYFILAFPDARHLINFKIDGFEQLGGIAKLGVKEVAGVQFAVYASNQQINIANSSLEVTFA